MLVKTFTFIDSHIKDTTFYFHHFNSSKCIVIEKDFSISMCGNTSFPKSLNGPYYTAFYGDERYISQDIKELCNFMGKKLDENNNSCE